VKDKRSKDARTALQVPGELRVARLCWLLAGALFVGFAANLLLTAANSTDAARGPWFLGCAFAALGLLVIWLALRLWRPDRVARARLTWLGLITALPLFLRFGRYSLLAGVVLIAVALLWTPSSIHYFRSLSRLAERS